MFEVKPMMKSCPYCGSIHDAAYICPRKPVRVPGKHRSIAGDLRHTNRWKEKSIDIRQRDLYLCRVCLDNDIANNKRLSVHHITPIKDDPERYLDEDNLITLCERHHEEAENGKIDEGYLRQLAVTTPKISPLVKRG